MSPLALIYILLIVVLLVIFGGLGGYYGPSWFGPGTTPSQGGFHLGWGGGGVGLVLLVVLILLLAGVRF